MNRAALARYLRRTALDAEFRELARRDPAASFAPFPDLGEDERALLTRQDESLHGLLALVAEDEASPPASRPASPPTNAVRSLGTIDLFLQLVPQPADDGPIPHAVALHAAPPAEAAGACFHIRIHPSAAEVEGGTRLAYTAEIEPLAGPSPAPAGHPWGHRADSTAAHAAAQAVLAAGPEERRQLLLHLLEAIAP